MNERSRRKRARELGAGLAAALIAASTVGCAAKVRQDTFDRTVADLREEMSELDGRVTENAARIDENEALLASMRDDLEALSAELGDVHARIDEIEEGLRLALPVHFEFDRADVRAEDEPVLDRFAAFAAKYHPSAIITVEGFADPAGSAQYNMWLSEQRARNVARYLTERAGLDGDGVRAAWYGEDRQVIPGARGPGPEGMENRRVTFVVELAEAPRAPAVVTMESPEGT